MLKKILLATVAVVLTSAAAPAADKTKFDFWFGLSGDLEKRVQDVCGRFNAAQGDFEVVCTSQGNYDAALQNTIAAFRANKQPTVVQVYDVGTATMMLSEAFYPANKLMTDNGYDIKWGDYIHGISSYYATSKGEMFSFPFNSSTALLYWNKAAFEKIGKTEAPKTWEEVEADATKLKAAGYECPVAINISANESWQLLEQFSALHNEPIASKNNGFDGLDAELVFNKTKFVKYVTDLKKWYDAGLVKIKAKEQGQDMVQAFAGGDCQMIMTSVGDHGTVAKTAKDGLSWDVAPLPVYAGVKRQNSLVGGASLWVLKGKSPAEYKGAAAFLAFIAKPESALFWSTVTGYIPVTTSGFEYMKAQGFYDKAPYKGREVAIASLTAAEPSAVTRGIRLGGFTQIRAEVGNGLQEIFSGKSDVQTAIDGIVTRGNAVLRRFEATYKGKTLP
ncbi:extracellular solute-binding protein [Siculibacillus lacustris]|uniref:sn-glycerol-3-phosphate-binding periplasmic protein UgpB n=1 Tax=Siculibacillus lacustris TaxID=1549641 RepID=A0A4Q9VXU6_9HYPH|nr:extracellular solute-binding protein [Siculibacillus lacustris]TBW41200.1 extracellular solute-binding protein [Siculibacillus lacustris]